MSDYTLQINLSPGDVAYAGLTVPALLDLTTIGIKNAVAEIHTSGFR